MQQCGTRGVWRHSRVHRTLSQPYVRRLYASQVLTSPEIYDVVCVGGGPAGLSLLNALRKVS